jgi:hypothetical protein
VIRREIRLLEEAGVIVERAERSGRPYLTAVSS